MKLVKSKNIWVWDGGYDSRHIPKAAKFRWNVDGKFWWTDQPDCAVTLIEYSDGKTKAELQQLKSEMELQLEASIATDADIEIPCPSGMEYYGYQKAGIAYALKNKNVLIGDDMGLGKTVQAIGVINTDKTIKRVLIVAPATLKYNWRKELNVWLIRKMSIDIISSNSQPSKADILIINYDILSSSKLEWVRKQKFDLIVADEAHYVKNEKAKRSAAFYAMAEKVNRKLMLTGTPILNRPVELFHIIKCLGFKMDYWAYVRRYCNAVKESHGWNLKGASNLEELQVRLRQSIMVRRQKADVLHELPPKRRQIIELDPNKYTSYINAEQEFLNRHTSTFMVEEDSKEVDMDDYETKVGSLKEMSATHIAEMARLRHMTALAKVPDVIDHLKSVLEETNKVVIFAHHRDVLQEIYKAFGSEAVMLIGGMDVDDKDDAVVRFQTDPKIKVFVGSIHAAGMGLTLTAASTVVFAELDWVPAILTQSEDRCHRIGQSESVLVQHIVIDGSIDSNLAKRIISKQNVIDRAMNADKLIVHRASEKKKIDDAIKRSHDEIEEAKKLVNTKLSAYAEQRAKEIIDGIPQYTATEIDDILYKLRYLITSKPGFNKMDVGFAHVLAAKDSLSNRQAFAAEKMLKKYSGQLQHI